MSSVKITCNIYIYINYCICYYMLLYTAYQLMVDTVLRPHGLGVMKTIKSFNNTKI